MDNQNPQIYPNNPYANPQQMAPDPLMVSDDDDDEGPSTLKKVLLIVSVIILMAASAFGGYYYGHNQLTKKVAQVQAQAANTDKGYQTQITNLNKQITTLQNAAKESANSNVTAKIPVSTMTTDVLNFLAAYDKANGQYLSTPNADLNNLLSSNNYEFKTTGSLSCPTDARFFTYSSTPNSTTQKYDNFTITYCNGSTIATATQVTMSSSSSSSSVSNSSSTSASMSMSN